MTERQKAKEGLRRWWQQTMEASLVKAGVIYGMPTDTYTDPTLAHLDPAVRPGMAALREGAEGLKKR